MGIRRRRARRGRSHRNGAGGNRDHLTGREDDESVRSLAHRLLSRLGYHVLVAKDPGEAIIVAETTPRPIQLLLSDLIMPQMRGSQLAERLAKVRPDLKILFMSAHRDHEPQRKDFPALDHPLLQTLSAGGIGPTGSGIVGRGNAPGGIVSFGGLEPGRGQARGLAARTL